MRKVICSGCGAAEPADMPAGSPHRIQPVSITVVGWDHTRSWEKPETYEEDLCSDCVKGILKRFFGVKVVTAVDPPIVYAVTS